MWMNTYINEIQKRLVTQYGFTPDVRGLPQGVPDGKYPMEIDGKLDRIEIKDGFINCCNFDVPHRIGGWLKANTESYIEGDNK